MQLRSAWATARALYASVVAISLYIKGLETELETELIYPRSNFGSHPPPSLCSAMQKRLLKPHAGCETSRARKA
jgi:hypothetical protein